MSNSTDVGLQVREFFGSTIFGNILLLLIFLTPLFVWLYRHLFVEPHLKVDSRLTKHPVKIIITRENGTPSPQTFNGNVWTIKIINRFRTSKSMRNTAGKIRISTIDRELPLSWMLLNGLLTDVSTGLGVDGTREQYWRSVGADYCYTLARQGIQQTDLIPRIEREVYFLVTLEGLDFALIVIDPRKNPLLCHEIKGQKAQALETDGVPLIYKIGTKEKFLLRFEGENHQESKGRWLTVNIKSYDEIILSKAN